MTTRDRARALADGMTADMTSIATNLPSAMVVLRDAQPGPRSTPTDAGTRAAMNQWAALDGAMARSNDEAVKLQRNITRRLAALQRLEQPPHAGEVGGGQFQAGAAPFLDQRRQPVQHARHAPGFQPRQNTGQEGGAIQQSGHCSNGAIPIKVMGHPRQNHHQCQWRSREQHDAWTQAVCGRTPKGIKEQTHGASITRGSGGHLSTYARPNNRQMPSHC